MIHNKKNLFIQPVFWSVMVLVGCCFVLLFIALLRFSTSVLPRCTWPEVFVICGFILGTTVYFSIPVFCSSFGALFSHDVRSVRYKRFLFLSVVLLVVVSFVWAGYAHPYFVRNLNVSAYEFSYDVTVSDNDERYNSPSYLNYSELNLQSDTWLEQFAEKNEEIAAQLKRRLTYIQIDSLLKDPRMPDMGFSIYQFADADKQIPDHAYVGEFEWLQSQASIQGLTITKYHQSQWIILRMIAYPILVALLSFVAFRLGYLMRRSHRWVLLLVVCLIVFPFFVIGTELIDLIVFRDWLNYRTSVWVLPVIAIAALIVLMLVGKKKSGYRLDLAFIEEHADEIYRFDELRMADDFSPERTAFVSNEKKTYKPDLEFVRKHRHELHRFAELREKDEHVNLYGE